MRLCRYYMARYPRGFTYYMARYPKGFTIIELMIVLAMIGILAGIAVPAYSTYVNKAKNKEAITDITIIAMEIDEYVLENGKHPNSLAELSGIDLLDPWGNPYQYLNFENVKGKGKMRKDRFMVPINTYYDLYSMGEDGRSSTPLTAKHSRDDIIRANVGQFVGLAMNY